MRAESKPQFTLLCIVLVMIAFFGGMLYLAKHRHHADQTTIHVRFAITSYGHTGTTWLATVLNKHPQIICAHRMANPTDNDLYFYSNEYTPEQGVAGYYNWIAAWATKDTRAIGNVHGLRLKWLLDGRLTADVPTKHPLLFGTAHADIDDAYYKRYVDIISINAKPDRDLVFVNMIRHPVTRLESCYVYWGKKIRRMYGLIGEIGYHKLYDMMELMMYYGVNIDSEKKMIFLLALAEEQLAYADMYDAINLGIPQIKYEDIIVNPKTLEDLIVYVTKGTVHPNAAEIDNLLQTKAINVGQKRRSTPAEIYASWEDWQKLAFYLHLVRNGTLTNNVYNELGYDLSFVKSEDFAKIKLRKNLDNVALMFSDEELLVQEINRGNLIKIQLMLLLDKNLLANVRNNATLAHTLSSGNNRFVQKRLRELVQL